MKCPNCGSEAPDDVLTCEMCQFVLRREPPPPPPPLAENGSAEPKRLDTPEALETLLKTAVAAAKDGRIPEVQRLTTRIFLECSAVDRKDFLIMGGDAWLESVRLPLSQAQAAKGMIAQAGDLASQGKFAQALPLLNQTYALAPHAPNQNMLFPMLILGVKGAAAATPDAAPPRNSPPGANTISASQFTFVTGLAPIAGAAPESQPAPPASGEPDALDSPEKVAALLAAALKADRAQDAGEAKRLATRLFVEVDLETCRDRILEAGATWLESLSLPPFKVAIAARLLDAGATMVGQERFSEAAGVLAQVSDAGGPGAPQDPAFRLLILGIQGAAEHKARMARYKELIDRGVKALARPGGKPEAADCFAQALTLLPASPRTAAERNIRGRLEAMIQLSRQ